MLRAIRRHTQLPTAQITFDDASVLEQATDEIYSYLLPKLQETRQEFWTGAVARVSYTLQEGVAVYAIPPRAAGNKVRAARMLDRVNNTYPLATYELEDINRWNPDKGTPSGLVVEGANIRLWPTPQGLAGYTLEVAYYLRPGRLVPFSSAGVVSSVSMGTATTFILLTRSADNEDIFDAPQLDLISPTSPFDTIWMEAPVANVEQIAGSLWQIELEGLMSVPVGSYVSLPETSPVVQAPVEWHPLLELKVAAQQLNSVGDVAVAKAKEGELLEKEKRTVVAVTPRREDAGRKVRNGTTKWRQGAYWW